MMSCASVRLLVLFGGKLAARTARSTLGHRCSPTPAALPHSSLPPQQLQAATRFLSAADGSAAMPSSIGRKLQDAAQRARGRHALKYQITVIPYFVGARTCKACVSRAQRHPKHLRPGQNLCGTHAGDLPKDVQFVCMAWERGTKLFVTDQEQVNPSTRAAFFKQYLRQVSQGLGLIYNHWARQ